MAAKSVRNREPNADGVVGGIETRKKVTYPACAINWNYFLWYLRNTRYG